MMRASAAHLIVFLIAAQLGRSAAGGGELPPTFDHDKNLRPVRYPARPLQQRVETAEKPRIPQNKDS